MFTSAPISPTAPATRSPQDLWSASAPWAASAGLTARPRNSCLTATISPAWKPPRGTSKRAMSSVTATPPWPIWTWSRKTKFPNGKSSWPTRGATPPACSWCIWASTRRRRSWASGITATSCRRRRTAWRNTRASKGSRPTGITSPCAITWWTPTPPRRAPACCPSPAPIWRTAGARSSRRTTSAWRKRSPTAWSAGSRKRPASKSGTPSRRSPSPRPGPSAATPTCPRARRTAMSCATGTPWWPAWWWCVPSIPSRDWNSAARPASGATASTPRFSPATWWACWRWAI